MQLLSGVSSGSRPCRGAWQCLFSHPSYGMERGVWSSAHRRYVRHPGGVLRGPSLLAHAPGLAGVAQACAGHVDGPLAVAVVDGVHGAHQPRVVLLVVAFEIKLCLSSLRGLHQVEQDDAGFAQLEAWAEDAPENDSCEQPLLVGQGQGQTVTLGGSDVFELLYGHAKLGMRADGKTMVHLASTTRARQQRNGSAQSRSVTRWTCATRSHPPARRSRLDHGGRLDAFFEVAIHCECNEFRLKSFHGQKK